LGSLPHIGNQRVRLVVDPPQVTLVVQLLKESQLPVIVVSVAGYPTGRHHTLIKASEARLAVQSGAEEIWVSVDDTITDSNTHFSEFITIREAPGCYFIPISAGLLMSKSVGSKTLRTPTILCAVQCVRTALLHLHENPSLTLKMTP